jgi:chromosome segregation ATPase
MSKVAKQPSTSQKKDKVEGAIPEQINSFKNYIETLTFVPKPLKKMMTKTDTEEQKKKKQVVQKAEKAVNKLTKQDIEQTEKAVKTLLDKTSMLKHPLDYYSLSRTDSQLKKLEKAPKEKRVSLLPGFSKETIGKLNQKISKIQENKK